MDISYEDYHENLRTPLNVAYALGVAMQVCREIPEFAFSFVVRGHPYDLLHIDARTQIGDIIVRCILDNKGKTKYVVFSTKYQYDCTHECGYAASPRKALLHYRKILSSRIDDLVKIRDSIPAPKK